MSTTVAVHPCNVCGRETSFWCSRCQKLWYCSEQHLQQDWPRHRRECVPVTYAQQPAAPPTIPTPSPQQSMALSQTAPAASVVSALYLNPSEERPKIISITCLPNPNATSRNPCPIPNIQSFFTETTPNSLVLTQGLNQEPLRFPLQLWYCPVSLSRGSPSNKVVHRITSGQTRKTWCGPVVVLKYSGSRRQNYGDATTHDLATLSAYFISLH